MTNLSALTTATVGGHGAERRRSPHPESSEKGEEPRWQIVDRVKAASARLRRGLRDRALRRRPPQRGCPRCGTTRSRRVRGIHQGYFDAGSDFVRPIPSAAPASSSTSTGSAIAPASSTSRARGWRARSARPAAGWPAPSVPPPASPPTTGRRQYRHRRAVPETFTRAGEALAEGGWISSRGDHDVPAGSDRGHRRLQGGGGSPVMATMFFQYEEQHDRDRTMWGESPPRWPRPPGRRRRHRGMNCGRGPDRAITIIREMRAVTDCPSSPNPNAGCPSPRATHQPTSSVPEAMARSYPALLESAATSWGPVAAPGPEHIRLIAEVVRATPEAVSGPPSVLALRARRARRLPLRVDPDEVAALPGLQEGRGRAHRRRARHLRRGPGDRRASHVPAGGLPGPAR
jgi:hypothetical protein